MNAEGPLSAESTGHKLRRRRVSRFRLVALVVCCVALLAGCGTSSGNSNRIGSTSKKQEEGAPGVFDEKSTMAAIQQRGYLLVGISFDVPPFAYNSAATGAPAGLDVQLAKNIATGIFGKEIEGKIRWITYTPDQFDLALRNNNVDIVLGRYAITPARKQFIDFAGPYFVAKQAVVVLEKRQQSKDAKEITELIGLNGKKVCALRGSTNVEALKQIAPQAQVQTPVGSIGECVALLTSQSVDAIVANNVDLSQVVSANTSSLKPLSATYGPEAYGVGIKQEAKDLRMYVNNRIEGWKDYDKAVSAELGNRVLGGTTKPPVERY